MAGRGGYRPGAGKPKGKWDRATLEAELAAAQLQLVEITKKRQAGRKLAIDVLDDIMHLSMGLAGKHQPLNPGEVPAPGHAYDEEKFRHYLSVTTDTAQKLAAFQSPKFKSTSISIETTNAMPAPLPGQAPRRLSAQDAYRMLRDSSELIELTPTSSTTAPVVVKLKPKKKKTARG